MPNVARYCKAFLASDLCEFPGWVDPSPPLSESGGADGDPPDGSDVYYLHENYVVTRGIYTDEQIVFDRVTPEWVEFCVNVLKFEIPGYVIEAVPVEREEQPAAS
jgi:hypothetical protein